MGGFAPGLQLLLTQQRRRGLPWARQRLMTLTQAGDEDPSRGGGERLGEASLPRPGGPLVWFHAGGESEAMALPELITRLGGAERDDLNVLITTERFSLHQQLEALLPETAMHQYAPYEVPQAVDAFLTHWKPDLAVWADRSLHPPVLLSGTAEVDLPVVMIDGRMPDEASQRWRWRSGMVKALLRRFEHILAADEQSARNLRRLGGASTDQVELSGFLQEGSAPPLPYVENERDYLANVFGARPVWLAVSVAPGEEGMVIDTHRQASRRSHRLLLILVPECPSDGPAMAARLCEDGWQVALRSADDEPGPDVQILVADQPGGELGGLWYRLAPVTVMGGQTFDGQAPPRNPHEAAALGGSAILFGPHPARFRERFNRLAEAGAARRVRDASKLGGDELEALLSPPERAATMAAAAWEVSTAGGLR